MNLLFHPWVVTLAQLLPPAIPTWDESETPKAAPAPKSNPLNFSDLQQGMRNWRTEEPNNAMRNWLLIGVASLALLVLAVQIHQRWQNRRKGLVDSEWALYRELTRGIALPWGSTLVLWWLARCGGVTMSALLLSPSLYRNTRAKWSHIPTFSLVRRLALSRVEGVERLLFG
jgi:hypothetical protein